MNIGIFITGLRVQFSKHVTDVGSTNLFLLFLLAAITFYPLLFSGFTTNDDATLALNWGNTSIWEIARIMSEKQGRFSFFWGYPLLQLPYAFDNRIWYLVMKMGSFFLLLSALYYAVHQSFRSSWLALSSLVLFLALIQNGWDHNALTSYPFAFNFYAVMFLVSLGLFASAIDRQSLPLAVLSGCLYFFALGSELFVLFFPFYVALLLSRATPSGAAINSLTSGKKYIIAVALPLLIYLAIYLLWRLNHPSNYDGNNLNGFNLLAASKVIVTYSLNAFPLASLDFMLSPEQRMLYTNSMSLREMLTELNITSLIKATVAGFLFAKLMTTERFNVPQARTLLIGAALAGVGIFLPNLLLGFIQKHQDWLASGSHSYLYTYYSFVSAVISSALILAYMKTKCRSWHPQLRLVFISTGVIVIMALSFIVDIRNQYIAFDQKLSHRKWQLMDVVIKSPAFTEIPDGSSVFAPTLSAHYRGNAQAPANYWTQYIKYKTGKSVQFVDDKCLSGAPCYPLVFRQESHSDNQFIVLAKINHPGLPVSSDLAIYSMPNVASAVLVATFAAGKDSPKIVMNDVPVTNVGTGLFSSALPQVSGGAFVQTAKVSGNVNIYPDQITISHYSVFPHLMTLSAKLAEGIDFRLQEYPNFLAEVSGMATYEPWARWTDGTTRPIAKFRFKQPLPKKFTLEIKAVAFGPNNGMPVKVRVGGVEKTFVITPKVDADTYRLVFKTDGTGDTLEIIPPKPTSPKEIDSKSGDTRKLGIALITLKIK